MKEQRNFLDRFIYAIGIGIFSLLLFSCEKEPNGNVFLSLVVKHNGKAIDHGNVTIKGEHGFEKTTEIDVYGQVWLPDVPPDVYAVSAEEYDPRTKQFYSNSLKLTLIAGGRIDTYTVNL